VNGHWAWENNCNDTLEPSSALATLWQADCAPFTGVWDTTKDLSKKQKGV
jgi:hypothetical protein